MKKLIFIATLMSLGSVTFAQDFVDNALLFSRGRISGSARIQALGGTQTSLGGDYSSAHSNPAGLAMYNRSEFTISPGYNSNSISSTYLDNKTNASKSSLNIPGLSLVYHHETGKEKGFLGGSFGLSLTRINDLNRNFKYNGTNSENSLVDYFINDAYGLDPNTMLWPQNGNPGRNFTTLTGLAYNNFLIEPYDAVDDEGRPVTAYRSVLSPLPSEGPNLPAEVRTLDQQEISTSKGSQYQWSFSYGANFSDKFFVGGGIGITSLRYKLEQRFIESNLRYDIVTSYDPLDNFEAIERYDIRGSGINLSLGAIFRPVDFLQVGASFVTPTYYKITDTYNARINSTWNMYNLPDNDPYKDSYPDQRDVSEHFEDIPVISEYNLSTPMRINTGATFISKFGFISADVEFVNYAKAKYNSDIDENFDPENGAVKSSYQPVVNYRLGAEYRYKIFRVRGGYNYMADPYRETNAVDRSIQSFTGGLGIRQKSFFVDLAGVFSSWNTRRSPYSVFENSPVALQKVKNSNFIVTVGFTF